MSHLLDPIVVFDTEGREVHLGDLWRDRTAVLVLVRHFGCLFCKQQVSELVPCLDRIHARGAELFVLGHGSVQDARTFRDEEKVTVPVFTDPSRESYCALNTRRGVASTVNPVVLVRGIRAWMAGFRQSRVGGDPLQQGGVLAIEPGGRELFRFISRHAGDHPTPARILAALGDRS